MPKKLIKQLLLVEDNPGDARLIAEMFSEQGMHDTQLIRAATMGEAEKLLSERAFDVRLT